MSATSAEVLRRGMQCLTKEMGVVEAERFISLVIREKFDYTKWQREYFDAKTPDEIRQEALMYESTHPFTGKAVRL